MDTPDLASTTEQLETCATHPVGRALRLLGDVWTLLIVYTLLSGTKRCGEVSLRAARFSHNQLRLVHNVLVLVRGWIFSLVEQKLSGCAPEFVFGLPN